MLPARGGAPRPAHPTHPDQGPASLRRPPFQTDPSVACTHAASRVLPQRHRPWHQGTAPDPDRPGWLSTSSRTESSSHDHHLRHRPVGRDPGQLASRRRTCRRGRAIRRHRQDRPSLGPGRLPDHPPIARRAAARRDGHAARRHRRNRKPCDAPDDDRGRCGLRWNHTRHARHRLPARDATSAGRAALHRPRQHPAAGRPVRAGRRGAAALRVRRRARDRSSPWCGQNTSTSASPSMR